MFVPLSCIHITKVVALPSIATKAKTHMIEVVVHMQTHLTTTLPHISHNIYHQVKNSSMLLFLMPHATKKLPKRDNKCCCTRICNNEMQK